MRKSRCRPGQLRLGAAGRRRGLGWSRRCAWPGRCAGGITSPAASYRKPWP